MEKLDLKKSEYKYCKDCNQVRKLRESKCRYFCSVCNRWIR